MTPPAQHETNPDIVEKRLVESIDEWPTYSRGRFVDWLIRLKMLPKESRRRVWIILSRRLPYPSLKELRNLYRRLLSPDRREEKQ